VDHSPHPPDATEFEVLRRIRRRRRCLWGLILVYVPGIWLTLELTRSDRKTGIVFGVWVVLVAAAALWTAFSRCPRCGNLFHVHGFMPLYLGRCLHCGLGLRGGRKG
jgi:hypothetical protein